MITNRSVAFGSDQGESSTVIRSISWALSNPEMPLGQLPRQSVTRSLATSPGKRDLLGRGERWKLGIEAPDWLPKPLIVFVGQGIEKF